MIFYYYIVLVSDVTEADFNKSTSTRETAITRGGYYVFKKAKDLPKWEIPHRLYKSSEIKEAIKLLLSEIS